MASPLDETTIFTPNYDENGLIPAIAIEQSSGKALMLAYMNEQAIRHTLESGYAHFWSRSRSKLWQKGEVSGNRLKVLDLLIDCDQDSACLFVEFEAQAAACHTARHSCFYRRISLKPSPDQSGHQEIKLDFTEDTPLFDPSTVYNRKA